MAEAFQVLKIVRVSCRCSRIKLSDPPLLCCCSNRVNIIGPLCRPPHVTKDFSIGTGPRLFMTIVKVCLPGLRHLLTEETRPKRNVSELQVRAGCRICVGCTLHLKSEWLGIECQ